MLLESKKPFAHFDSLRGLCLGLECARKDLLGETYDRWSGSSWGFRRRIEEPLFGIFVGVFPLGVVA
jgi:hypothetical protein